jgi:hypothetical protein
MKALPTLRPRLTTAETKSLLLDTTADMETTEMGYIVILNKQHNTWELLAPGPIHLETFRTKAEANAAYGKRESFNRCAR